MKRLLGAVSVAFVLGALLAPQAAMAQSSGAPPGCSGNSCNPYFAAYFPPSSWPAMSWVDHYSPSAMPPGNACMPYLPGAPLGPYASSPNYYCTRGQGVVTSRYSPPVSQQIMSTRYDMPAASGAGYFMSRALISGDVPPQGTNSATSAWSGNQLYPASQYSLDCSQNNYLIATYSLAFGTTGRSYSCVMNEAPVMDFAEIRAKLENAGYVWYVSYPFRDVGSGRAVVTWAKYGADCGSVSIPAPAWWVIPQSYPTRLYGNSTTGKSGYYACQQGYARVKNAGWVNQFDYSGAICTGYGWSNGVYGCIYDNYRYGDYLGEYFATLDSDSQARALRLVVAVSSAGGYFNQMNPAGAYLVPIIDPWVGEPPPPVVVVANPVEPQPPIADPVNVGGVTIGVGTGTLTPGGIDTSGGTPVDWDTYCRTATLADGKPQSDFWIQGCLAQNH